MGGYEVMIVIKGDAKGATAEIAKTRNALDGLTASAKQSYTAMKRETPITETYELSRAVGQLGRSLNALTFVPIIGDFAATGSSAIYVASSIKYLAAGLKSLGGVSITALGPLGMAGAIGAVIAGGLLLGKVINDIGYKLTGIDPGGLHKIKETMEAIKEETEFVSKRQEAYNKQLAMLGAAGATYEERVKNAFEMEKAGILVREEGTNKLIRASEVAAKAQKALEDAERKLAESWVEDTNKMLEAQEKLNKELQDMIDKATMTPLEYIRNQAAEWEKEGRDRVSIEKAVQIETEKILKEQQDSAIKGEIETAQARIAALGQWRTYLVDTYNYAIKKAQEYFKISRAAGELSAEITKYLSERKAPALSPEDQMKKEREEFRKSISVAYSTLDIEASKKAFELGETYLEKWKSYRDVFGSTDMYVSEITREMEKLSTMSMNLQANSKAAAVQAGNAWQDFADQAYGAINKVDKFVDDFQTHLQSLQMKLDVNPAIQAAEWARSQIDTILPDIIQKTIDLKITGLPNEGVSSDFYSSGINYNMNWEPIEPAQFGIPYVPETKPYLLHQSETVLSPQEAKEYRDNRNYLGGSITLNSVLNVNDAHVKDGRRLARQYDEEMADMIKTGRSKITKAIREKLKYYNNFQ